MGQKRKKKEKTLSDWMIQIRKKKLKQTKKTLEECEQLLKERRSKYEHLNFFSKRDEQQHIKALFRGYETEHFCLLGYTPQPGARPGFKCRFTFDDLEDEYLIELANFAIEYYNSKENAQLAFKDLLYYDTRSNRFGDEHLLFLAACNLSNDEIKCYRTAVRACYPNGDKCVLAFAHWRNKDSVEEEQTGEERKRGFKWVFMRETQTVS